MPWVIGTIMIVSFVSLALLQSTNLWKDFAIESSSDLLLLYALSGLNFAALVIFGFIFLRSIIKLMRERRTLTLGAQIKTRLLLYFFAISLLPIIAMAVFSYLFMNRALDRWFTSIPENVLRETQGMQRQSLLERTAKLDESVRMLAVSLEDARVDNDLLESIAAAGSLVHISVAGPDHKVIAAFDRPVDSSERLELDQLLAGLRTGKTADPALRDGKGFDAGVATLSGGRQLVVVPDPFGERTISKVVENSVVEFERLKQKQVTIRQVGLLTLGVLTFLLMFASTWIAIHVARGLTAPIKSLAEGAKEIAAGNLGHRVDVLAEDELAILVGAFNEMATKLDSTSLELRERRRYIETVLATLPTGVISLDADDRITTINGAALTILRAADHEGSDNLKDLMPAELGPVVDRLVSRARRAGRAADQVTLRQRETDAHQHEIALAITAQKLPSDGGVVLVFEDLSELLTAQRASAWQEVARRMAHEIKNPLTPIQLSAERIAKRFLTAGGTAATGMADDRAAISSVVNQSTNTILREVTSLKTMVDEFSRFARLPATKLAPGRVNDVIGQAASVLAGRLPAAALDLQLDDKVPLVDLDFEQLKRVFVNLFENAVEAAESDLGDLLITVSTRHDNARDIVVAEVSDNGKGIAPGDMQKLFQPYFSTKSRGTGLGLAIVHRIVAEHNGNIKIVANQPRGARFIIELPALS
jgi:nitrogen fixation/metabolism regulation signal transduction histidine kinase